MKQIWKLSFFCMGLTIVCLPPIQAGPIINQTFSGSFPASITGTLPSQDTALLEMFTLPSASDITVTSTSYAGGGFEPNLLLYSGRMAMRISDDWRRMYEHPIYFLQPR